MKKTSFFYSLSLLASELTLKRQFLFLFIPLPCVWRAWVILFAGWHLSDLSCLINKNYGLNNIQWSKKLFQESSC